MKYPPFLYLYTMANRNRNKTNDQLATEGDETKTVETEAKTEPVKPKKEWKYDFKPGDSVTIWGTGEFATMKKGTKHNTTGAMAAILVEKGAASLTEIKPDEEK